MSRPSYWFSMFVTLACVAGSSELQAAQPAGRVRQAMARTAATQRLPAARTAQRPTPAVAPTPAPEIEEIPPGTAEPYHDSPLLHDSGEFVDGPGGPGCGMPCDDCCDPCVAGPRGGFFFGADYLLMKPRLSESVAEVRRTIDNRNDTNPEISQVTDTAVPYPYDYQGSVRAFAGYRLWDCGSQVQFTYWRLRGDASVTDGPANFETGPIIAGQLENNAPNGGFFSANSDVRANLYDIDFSKCWSPMGDCCDGCCCPRWDFRYSAGVRIAQVDRHDSNVTTTATGASPTFGDIDAEFRGAGPRVGLLGRRYFGPCGRLSLFAKGSFALLLGDYEVNRVRFTPGSTDSTENGVRTTIITAQRDDLTRIIPVPEIEVGGTFQVTERFFVSAGWFIQAFADLGSSAQIDGTNFGPLDDANILAFDGLFVRGEMVF